MNLRELKIMVYMTIMIRYIEDPVSVVVNAYIVIDQIRAILTIATLDTYCQIWIGSSLSELEADLTESGLAIIQTIKNECDNKGEPWAPKKS